jgi:hypothetical protein
MPEEVQLRLRRIDRDGVKPATAERNHLANDSSIAHNTPLAAAGQGQDDHEEQKAMAGTHRRTSYHAARRSLRM